MTRKLKLNRETIRALRESELSHVKGGRVVLIQHTFGNCLSYEEGGTGCVSVCWDMPGCDTGRYSFCGC